MPAVAASRSVLGDQVQAALAKARSLNELARAAKAQARSAKRRFKQARQAFKQAKNAARTAAKRASRAQKELKECLGRSTKNNKKRIAFCVRRVAASTLPAGAVLAVARSLKGESKLPSEWPRTAQACGSLPCAGHARKKSSSANDVTGPRP